MSERLVCTEVWGGNRAVDTAFAVPGVSGALYSRPAEGQSGGDIYLVSTCNRSTISKVVLADVAGHGERVARIGQMLADLLRANVSERDNDRFLEQLNRQFEVENDLGVVFATLACTTYFPRSGRFCFAYAGHPQILFGRDGRFEPLDVPASPSDRIANLPIGVASEMDFHEGCMQLQPGDWLILFTDGVVEARNQTEQDYGLARMLADIHRLALSSPMVVKNGLLTRLAGFASPRRLDQDDLTLIVLRVDEPPRDTEVAMTAELARLLGREPEVDKP